MMNILKTWYKSSENVLKGSADEFLTMLLIIAAIAIILIALFSPSHTLKAVVAAYIIFP
jgi:hypothetical protein